MRKCKPLTLILLSMLTVSCHRVDQQPTETAIDSTSMVAGKTIQALGEGDDIVFTDYDGKILKNAGDVRSYAYDGDIPTRPDTEMYHYVFEGWDCTYDSRRNQTIAKAEFHKEKRQYRATFVDEDGTVVSTGSYTYGETPVAPEGFDSLEDVKPIFRDVVYHRLSSHNDNPFYSEGLVFVLLDNKSEFAVLHYYGESTNVVIPESFQGIPVTTIYKDAFIKTPDIEYISIPKTITQIQPNAFRGIKSLKSIDIDDGNAKYKLDAGGSIYFEEDFHGSMVSHLVYVPSGKTDMLEITKDYDDIYDGALNCTNAYILKLSTKGLLTFRDVFGGDYDNNVRQLILTNGYLRSEMCLGMKNLYSCTVYETTDEDYQDLAICRDAFRDCVNLRGISLPNHITAISSGAFANCTSLETVTLGFDELSIGFVDRTAFLNTPKLHGNAKDGIEYLGNSKYPYQIPVKKQDTIPSKVIFSAETLTIPDGFFEGNQQLTNIEFEAGSRLKTIGEKAFFECSNLQMDSDSLILPSSLEEIGYKAFAKTDFDENDDVWVNTRINNALCQLYALNVSPSCSTFSIPSTAKFIDAYGIRNGFDTVTVMSGNNTFTAYKSQFITASGTMIHAARGATKMTSSDFGSRTPYLYYFEPYCFYKTSIQEVCYFKSGDRSNTFPNTLGEGAFKDCKSLKSLFLGEDLTEIGDEALYNAYGTRQTVNIYPALTRVGKYALYNSTSYTITYNFRGQKIPETWDPNFDGRDGACHANSYHFNQSF